MVGQRGARQDSFRAGVQLERAAPLKGAGSLEPSLGDGGVEKDLPKALEVPSRCGCARVLMLRSISANSWRRRGRGRVSAYSCDPDFLAARRLASDPRPGEALMLRVVVSSTSARRQTRPKRLAVSPVASPQWLRALAQRPRQHPRPQDRGSSPHLDQLTRPMPN